MPLPPAHRNYPTRLRTFAKQLRNDPTNAEYKLWGALRKSQTGAKFRRQQQIDEKYIVDFVCYELKIIIEVDGATHSSEEEIARDKVRDEYLNANGWEVFRVQNMDVYNNLDGFLEILGKRIWEIRAFNDLAK